jgi:hypothetical protein
LGEGGWGEEAKNLIMRFTENPRATEVGKKKKRPPEGILFSFIRYVKIIISQ